MSKIFLTLLKAIDMLHTMPDNEDVEIRARPPENEVDVTHEEQDTENLKVKKLSSVATGYLKVFRDAVERTPAD